MISRILRPLALGLATGLLALGFAATAAHAHPHVYVTMKSEIVYDAEGRMTGIRHHWTFDDMFSSYATQGLESKEKGKFSREELQPLAEVNVTSLKEFDFFTQGKLNGKKAEFEQPVDYFLEQNRRSSDAAFYAAPEKGCGDQGHRSRNLSTRFISLPSNSPRRSRSR